MVSADGTEIGYEARGDGRPLVLVHGTAGRKETFRRLVPHLTEDFTVVTYDRRGRGASGDSDEYDFSREIEDLQAVVADLDSDPVVFGHSFGGMTALEAADGMAIDRLILYEPSILLGEPHDGTLSERIRARLEDGDRAGGAEEFFEAVGAGHLVGGPVVERAADIVETIAREIEVVEAYDLGDPETGVPTLLLVGEDGPDHLKESIRALEERLPDTERATLADTGHLGNNTAPERVADAVREFAR